MYKVAWLFDLVSHDKIKNERETYGDQMDTKLEEVVVYYMGLTLKMSHHS